MILKPEKCTKRTQNVPNGHIHNIPNVCQIFQMAIKLSTFTNPGPSKIYPNWYFWFEKKPSGNPDAVSALLRR
jgi:hypothetical protein